jgi:peroxiredoxin family protein
MKKKPPVYFTFVSNRVIKKKKEKKEKEISHQYKNMPFYLNTNKKKKKKKRVSDTWDIQDQFTKSLFANNNLSWILCKN